MRSAISLLLALLASAALAGCLGDGSGDGSDDGTAGGAPPAYRGDTFDYPAVSAFGDVDVASAPGDGQGLWLHQDHLYWTNGGDLAVFDVSQPDAPVQVGAVEDLGARDVDILEWQGRTYALLAPNSAVMHVLDVTDPADPHHVASIETGVGVHNVAAVPGTPYIYVSGASADRIIEVVDITDPRDPQVHSFAIPETMDDTGLNSDGCHDVTVRVDLGRAYCAGGGGQYGSGGGETFIWDITDEAGGPLDPTWVSFMDDDRVVYNHQAMVNDDGTVLIVDDEYISANCVSFDLPVVPSTDDPKVTSGAAWIWDISDETDPQLMGIVQNDAIARQLTTLRPDLVTQNQNCGSHFGDVVPSNDAFVMGWYGGGTILVDYSDPQNPVILDAVEAQGSTWDARVHRGFVYHASGDLLVTPLE